MQKPLRKLINDQSGQSLTEYAMILVMVVIVCIVAVGLIGTTIKETYYDRFVEEFPDGSGGGG